MGKQINFYMDYESFILLAEKAIKLGCEIIREYNDGISRGFSVELISEDCNDYFFHVPEAGEIETETCNKKKHVIDGYSASGNTLIEAGYSFIIQDEKRITRSRLFCITGYYDDSGNEIKRPDTVTKIYNSLARYVKKIAPYTEIEHYVVNPLYEGKKFKSKEYITEKCQSLVINYDYILG